MPPPTHTTYTEGCHLRGDADLYGPGVRVSYYLFFFATLLSILQRAVSSTPHLKAGPIARTAAAINILTFALLIVLIRNTLHGSFAVLEWFLTYPTILVAFISLCVALPWMENAGTLLCLGATLSCLTICQPFLYWKYLNQGRKDGCELKYWFFGEREFYGSVWTGFFKAMSIIACIAGVVFYLIAGGLAIYHAWQRFVLIWNHGVEGERRERERRREERGKKINSKKRVWLRVVGLVVLFFAGIVTMAMTENTIQLNDIDLSDTPLGSTSQLIPFLTGLLSLLSTVYSCIPFLQILSSCLGRKLGLREKGSREQLLPNSNDSGSGTAVHETGYV